MKSVLISTKPRWCELIANREKTIEVRKTRPKIATPFKCYIYETKGKTDYPTFIDEEGHEIYEGRGQVIGEFICDEIEAYEFGGYEADYLVNHTQLDAMRLNYTDLIKYGKGKTLYGWHISDLKIYDKAKEATEFYRLCLLPNTNTCYGSKYLNNRGEYYECGRWISKAPQSWCYVKEAEQ